MTSPSLSSFLLIVVCTGCVGSRIRLVLASSAYLSFCSSFSRRIISFLQLFCHLFFSFSFSFSLSLFLLYMCIFSSMCYEYIMDLLSDSHVYCKSILFRSHFNFAKSAWFSKFCSPRFIFHMYIMYITCIEHAPQLHVPCNCKCRSRVIGFCESE